MGLTNQPPLFSFITEVLRYLSFSFPFTLIHWDYSQAAYDWHSKLCTPTGTFTALKKLLDIKKCMLKCALRKLINKFLKSLILVKVALLCVSFLGRRKTRRRRNRMIWTRYLSLLLVRRYQQVWHAQIEQTRK